MKKLTYIFLVLLMLAACTSTSRHPQLVAVDSLLLSRPDSALTLLRSMSFSSTSDRMYYYLLLADACNKCYDTLPSDSILQKVADYYDRHGSANEQVRAHYLLGCVYRDEGNAPLALKSYRIATEQADTTADNCDFLTLSRVYGQIAILFHMQRAPRLEIDARRKAINYAWRAKDTISAIIFHEYLTGPFHMLNMLDSALYYNQESARLYKEIGREDLAAGTLGFDIDIYLRWKEYDKVKKAIDEYEQNTLFFQQNGEIQKGREVYYSYKASYYEMTGALDSAEFYYRKTLYSNPNKNAEETAYKGLLSLYQKLRKSDSIAKYSFLYCQANDSASFAHSADEITRMQAMYDYSSHQEAARRAELKAERTKNLLFVLLAAGVIVIAVVTLFYLQYRNRKRAEIQQLTNDYGRALMEYNKQSAELERLKQEDSSRIEEKQQEVGDLKEKLQKYQSALQTSNANRKVSDFTESDIVTVFREKAKGGPKVTLPSEEEWKRLVSQFSQSVPFAFSAMGRNVILSANEMRVCILLLSGFKIADIAILLDCSPQSITNIKARANNKLFAENSAATLEKNLMKTVGLPQT